MTTDADNPCIVVLLTFNCAAIIAETLAQARKVSGRMVAVDSGSTDGTLRVLEEYGCEVLSRPFRNYSDQRNWAIAQLNGRCAWQLHLDADEVLDEDAVAQIRAVVLGVAGGVGGFDAYLLRRRDYFLGRMLHFSGLNPWHLRLFRSGTVRCEDRLYDQHFVTMGPTGRLGGWLHDRNHAGLAEWTLRHNRWSDLEAQEISREVPAGDATQVLSARLDGDPRERRRALKRMYYRLPGTLRALMYFLYRYVFCLGFLDGRAGFYFAFFQALWFRMLVDAKLYERRSSDA